MKTKTIKTQAEAIDAIDDYAMNCQVGDRDPFELTFKDGTTIIDVRFGYLHISSPYGLTVTREIDREEAERYRVRVDHPAFPSLNRYFENEYGEAREFERSFDNISDAKVDAKMVKVLVDEGGNVVAELDDDGTSRPLTPQDNGDDIPF